VAVGERLGGRFGAGAVFVPLAAVNRPVLVLAGIGRALDADLGTGAPLEALVERLGDGRWLLVLDNLEQVIEVACDLEALLARCRGVAILATSRTVLGLRAEREFSVPPLPLPADPATVPVDVLLTSSPAVAVFVDAWTVEAAADVAGLDEDRALQSATGRAQRWCMAVAVPH
jgi:hypothetical protein